MTIPTLIVIVVAVVAVAVVGVLVMLLFMRRTLTAERDAARREVRRLVDERAAEEFEAAKGAAWAVIGERPCPACGHPLKFHNGDKCIVTDCRCTRAA